MASAVYPQFFVNILNADFTGGLDGADIKVLLFDTADGAYDNTDNDEADLTGAGIAGARSANLGSKTITASGDVVTFDAANTTITACPLGDACERAIVYLDSGGAAGNLLIADLALDSAITPNGGDISVSFHASGILTITCTPA